MGVDEVGVDEMGSRRSGTTPFNLPIIALTAHFKYHGSFDHEHSLPLLIKRSWFNYIY